MSCLDIICLRLCESVSAGFVFFPQASQLRHVTNFSEVKDTKYRAFQGMILDSDLQTMQINRRSSSSLTEPFSVKVLTNCLLSWSDVP